MSKDSLYSLVLIGCFLVVIANKQFSSGILNLLLLSRPFATIALFSLVVFAYSKNFLYTSLALTIVSVYLLKDLWRFRMSDLRRFQSDISKDQARFDPANSIDLQFAQKTATHDPPAPLASPFDPTLLIYPPSKETLFEMNG